MSKRWMQVLGGFFTTLLLSILLAVFVVYSEKGALYEEQTKVISEFKKNEYSFTPQSEKYPYTIHYQEDWHQLDGGTKVFKISEEVDRVIGELARHWDVGAAEKAVATNKFENIAVEWVENNQTSQFKSIKIEPLSSTKNEMKFAYVMVYVLKNETKTENQKTYGEMTMMQVENMWKIKSDKTLGKK